MGQGLESSGDARHDPFNVSVIVNAGNQRGLMAQ